MEREWEAAVYSKIQEAVDLIVNIGYEGRIRGKGITNLNMQLRTNEWEGRGAASDLSDSHVRRRGDNNAFLVQDLGKERRRVQSEKDRTAPEHEGH